MRAPIHDLHISNLLSYVSLFCGVVAIGAAMGGADTHAAGALLAGAALADTFDGRFARRFQRTARQAAAGAQVDSLVDACVFGIAPVAVFAAIGQPAPGLGSILWWLAACAYVLAVVTRLGFFNVEADAPGFVGVPTPAIGLVWATLLMGTPSPRVIGVALLVAALAMTWPIVVPRPRGVGLVAFTGWAVGLVATHLISLLRVSP